MNRVGTAVFVMVLAAGCSAPLMPDPFIQPSAQSAEWIDPAVSTAALGKLRVAVGDRNGAVKLLYPLPSAMLARNMGQLQFQWTYSGGQAFRVRAKSAALDKSFYVPASACTKNLCSFSPPGNEWLAVTNAADSTAVSLAVYALNGDVYASSTVAVNISPEDVKGSLYYFSSSLEGVVRLPFGATSPTFFAGVGATGGDVSTNCVGCHAVSHDGKKVAGVVGGGDGYLALYDATTPTATPLLPPDSGVRSNFNSFNADGTLLITNWAGTLSIIDVATGETQSIIPADLIGGRAVMPEWSPDGTKIVFVRIPPGGGLFPDVADPSLRGTILAGDWLIDNAGEIVTMAVQGASFGAPQVIVPVGNNEYHYYPSWSPDSNWIVFNTGSLQGASSPIALAPASTMPNVGGFGIPAGTVVSYDQKTSRLRLVRATGGAPIELARATQREGLTTAWPKFAPFQQAGGQYVFITFSSKADYGFVVTGEARPQIWMAAIDLSLADEIERGVTPKNITPDPSFAPFWLPFQDSTTNNHATIWTNQIQCTQNSDCGAGATCIDNACVGIVQ